MDEAQAWLAVRQSYDALIRPYSADLDERMLPAPKPFAARYSLGARSLLFVAGEHEVGGATFRLVDEMFAVDPPRHIIIEGFATQRGLNSGEIAQLALEGNAGGWEVGEGAHAVRHCLARGIEFEGGEPSDEAMLAELRQQGLSAEDVANATLVAALVQNLPTSQPCPPVPGSDSICRWRSVLRATHPAVAANLIELDCWWRRSFGMGLADDCDWCRRADPGGSGRASDAMRAMNLHRDRHLYRLLLDRLAYQARVGIVYGGSHLASLWRSLEQALGPPKLTFP